MKPRRIISWLLLAAWLAGADPAPAAEPALTNAPVTARDFYNAGTHLLAAKKLAAAETMFLSALAAQDERVQPPALYNLAHTLFAAGDELLKKGPDAQKTTMQARAALAAGNAAIRQAENALAGNEVERMMAAYLDGRGARRELRAAEKTVRAALEVYGQTLQKWQRAADDFKGAAEMNPADPQAAKNAATVERHIARLIDSVRQMQAMLEALGQQQQALGKLISQLKGRIPAPQAPPGAAGDEEDEPETTPESLAGRQEDAGRAGEQMPVPVSPEQAGQMLDNLAIDGSRRLPMSDQPTAPPKGKTGRQW